MTIAHVKSVTIADFTGTVTAFNSQGSTATVAASALALPSDWNSAHNLAFSLGGNTNNASTISGSNIQFSGAGGVTLVGSNDTLGISGVTTNGLISAINVSAGTTSSNQSSIGFSNANGISFGFSGGSITASSVPQETISMFIHPAIVNNTITMSLGGGSSVYVEPFLLPEPISVGFIRLPVSMSCATTTFATGAGAYGSQQSQVNTLAVNFYSRGVGGDSDSLQYVTGTTVGWTYQISYSGTSSTHSVSHNFSFPMSTGITNTQLTSNQAAGSSAVNEVPAGTANFQGARLFDIPFEGSLSAGNWWIGVQRSSTTGGTGGNINLGISGLAITEHNSAFGYPGSATNSSINLMPGLGSWSTNTVGRTTNSMGINSISSMASHPQLHFQLHRVA